MPTIGRLPNLEMGVLPIKMGGNTRSKLARLPDRRPWLLKYMLGADARMVVKDQAHRFTGSLDIKTPDTIHKGDHIMSETTAFLWMMAIVALRLGLPLIVILVGGNLLNAWVERHRDEVKTA